MSNLSKNIKSRINKMIPLGIIALIVSGNSAYASPFTERFNLGETDITELLRVVSQNNSEPPEIIIGDPNTLPEPPNTDDRSPVRVSTDTRFNCEFVNGEYTVMYRPENQPNTAYPWAVPTKLGGGWSPERRCNEISSRLEAYREDGLLEMTTGFENNYDTICVTTQIDPTECRIVLTVPPGQDAQLTRDLIFENLLIADDGLQTQGVYTYGSLDNGEEVLGQIGSIFGKNKTSQSPDSINLRPFLDPTDGGTGENLKRNNVRRDRITNPTNRERKPSIFK